MVMFLLLLSTVTDVSFSTGEHKGVPNYGIYQAYYVGDVSAGDTLDFSTLKIAPFEYKSIYIRGDSIKVYYKITPALTEIDSVGWIHLTTIEGATSQPAYYQGFNIPVAIYCKFRIVATGDERIVFYINLWKQPYK